MKIDLDEYEPMEADESGSAPAKSSPAAQPGPATPTSSPAPAAASAPAPINKTLLDEKRSRLREQLKRDRADSKRARSIRRNSELSREGLDEEEMELKRKLDYAKTHEEGAEQHQQEATESAKKFSKWVNQNMMINKDKKKAPEKTESEKILEEAKSSDDLLK
ncbi:hypothetical protein [Succinivibrio dextrinosolvens]|uniref:hypothetical protein n=1 Tax=Succinivibrio dextrinosolvens TaxID=83771 RepID=UPI00241CC28D|nr:hypothetical protein [Succinivibrio dextrinosolvens]MBE6422967.1 hypothetical protein [Succinivibrio dextrinosolvens]